MGHSHTKILTFGCAALVGIGTALAPQAPAAAAMSGGGGFAFTTHTGNGQVINVLNLGDSYAAGNGGGDYYNYSPDDPSAPPSYSGSGCYKSLNNASYLLYQRLSSTGAYINRACSGNVTADVLPQTQDLVDGGRGSAINLITLSTGGDDASFADLVKHCFVLPFLDPAENMAAEPKAGTISSNCYDLIGNLVQLTSTDPASADPYSPIVQKEHDVIETLLSTSNFSNADLILDGYPLLAGKHVPAQLTAASVLPLSTSDDPTGRLADANATWQYAARQLKVIEKNVADEQARMIADLDTNGDTAGRVDFNNLYALFGGHSVGSANDWFIDPPDPDLNINFHPNTTGWKHIATGLAAIVTNRGWTLPLATSTLAAPVFTYLPGQTAPDSYGGYLLADSHANGVYVPLGSTTDTADLPSADAIRLASCTTGTLRLRGWLPSSATAGKLLLDPHGQDSIDVICAYPRKGDIATVLNDTGYYDSYVVTAATGPLITWNRIPTAWMYDCVNNPGVRLYLPNPLQARQFDGAAVLPGKASCTPFYWFNQVIYGPDGVNWFVETDGMRHPIPNQTVLNALIAAYGSPQLVLDQVDVDTIPYNKKPATSP